MKLVFLMLLLSIQMISLAQGGVKPKPVVKPTIVKSKVPTLTASLAGMQTGTYGVGAAKLMIDSNLVLKDENGKKYPIFKCSFLYKRKMVYKDEESGETKTTWEYLENVLKNNAQLDSFWRQTIKGDLKPGEELLFEGILADSQKGYMIPVKGITITVK
jgi:hypothetical protein